MQCQGPGCTNPIVQVPGGHRARKYCSDRCRVAAGRQNRATASSKLKPVKAGSKLVEAGRKKKPVKGRATPVQARVAKKPVRRTRASGRLTRADMQALSVLDRLVAEERRIEQTYHLPFRNPRQVATSFQPCTHCRKDVAWLIFGDLAKDAAGLEAYARLMADTIKQHNLLTYIIAPPSDANDLDSPALLLKVHPSQDEEAYFTTPPAWEALIKRLSDEHCQRQG